MQLPNDNKNGLKIFEKASVEVIKSFKANQKFVVEGNFNVKYDNINSSQTISNYVNLINSIGCSQFVDKPRIIGQISKTATIFNHIQSYTLTQN